jgi:hypothetical protein
VAAVVRATQAETHCGCFVAIRSMHWSLVVVCHPGLAFPKPVMSAATQAFQQEASKLGNPLLQPTACIMHLDSLRCHSTHEIIGHVRK